MPRKRRPSDDVQKYRKRVRRLADRIERTYGNAHEAQRLRKLADPSTKASISELNSAHIAGNARYPTRAKTARKADVSFPTRLSQERKSRAKTKSDELYNARRRLRRQAAKIERDAQKLQGVAKEQAKGFAAYLREISKAGKQLTTEQRQAEIERLSSIREATKGATYSPFRVRRRNLIFMQQLNAAGTQEADSSIPERAKDVFWAATKGIWTSADIPRNERYDRIAEYFYNLSDGASSTAKDFQAWLEREKGIDARDVYGDLQLIYEYVTSELNDPMDYESPEIPYGTWINRILFAR